MKHHKTRIEGFVINSIDSLISEFSVRNCPGGNCSYYFDEITIRVPYSTGIARFGDAKIKELTFNYREGRPVNLHMFPGYQCSLKKIFMDGDEIELKLILGRFPCEGEYIKEYREAGTLVTEESA